MKISEKGGGGTGQAPPELRSGIRVTVIGLILNAGLTFIKLWIGLAAQSQALIADGVHSFSDLFGDFLVIFGLSMGHKEADENHPFGHGRIETLAAMAMGMLLLGVAAGIIIKSLGLIYSSHHSEASPVVMMTAILSILLKETMYRYTMKVGRRIKSLVVVGNAWHHRSDAFSSIAVLIGVLATYLNPDWYLADSIAALVVSIFIIKVGVSLVRQSLLEVVDTSPDPEVVAQLVLTAVNTEGVRQAHDIKARHSGSQILVEIHIVVDPDLTVRQGHNIARTVKRSLLDEVPDVSHVIVHVDPDIKTGD